jgi:L-asparaginase II
MRKLAIKTRANKRETEHYGYIALYTADQQLDKTYNDQESFYLRSCIKAIQAKVCQDILLDDLENEFLTIAASSHLATEEQLNVLKKMQNKFSIDANELICGTKSNSNSIQFKTKMHNYCSGKHMAFIAACKKAGYEKNYYELSHPLQTKVLEELKSLSCVSNIDTAIDGCGLPTFFMSIADLAKIFTEAAQKNIYQKIFKTINNYSHLISKQGRFDQELMQKKPQEFFAKSGAEGMILVNNLISYETLVIKVLDGNSRIKDLVAQKILEELGWLKKDAVKLDNNIYNSQGLVVGEII